MDVLWLYLFSPFVSLYENKPKFRIQTVVSEICFFQLVYKTSAGKMTENCCVLENAHDELISFSSLGQQWPFVPQKDIPYSKTEITAVHIHHQERLA